MQRYTATELTDLAARATERLRAIVGTGGGPSAWVGAGPNRAYIAAAAGMGHWVEPAEDGDLVAAIDRLMARIDAERPASEAEIMATLGVATPETMARGLMAATDRLRDRREMGRDAA